MNTEELTPIVTAHQSAISRHDTEMASIRITLAESATRHDQEIGKINATLDRITTMQALNQEQLNQFLSGMIDLRNQVADFVKSREQPK